MSRWYGWLMQNVLYPAMLAPTCSRSLKLAKEIRRRQNWPIERLRSYQLDRLRQLVELAGRESPFYRERFAEAGLNENALFSLDDLRRFPVTTKADIERNFPDRLVVASRRSDDWQYVGTRGTTRRVIVVHDFERRDIERAGIMVAMTEDSSYRYGDMQVSIPPDACSVFCGTEGTRAESVTAQLMAIASRKIPWNRESISDLRGLVMDTWVNRTLVIPPLQLNDDEALSDCIETVRRVRPEQLMALPEYLRGLADYVTRAGISDLSGIPVIRPMGANFPAAWRPAIENAFQGQVREHYGSREMGPMAFDCRYACGMHLLMDQHLIEIERSGQHVAEGEVGRVLVTDLNNLSMPIIRYDIGDLARLTQESCRCGRQTPRIFMEGRMDDAFVDPKGKVLTAEMVSNFFAEEPSVRDFELIEGRNLDWTLRVVPTPGTSIDHHTLAQKLNDWSGFDRKVAIRVTDGIKPEASGKFRHCKSNSYSSF